MHCFFVCRFLLCSNSSRHCHENNVICAILLDQKVHALIYGGKTILYLVIMYFFICALLPCNTEKMKIVCKQNLSSKWAIGGKEWRLKGTFRSEPLPLIWFVVYCTSYEKHLSVWGKARVTPFSVHLPSSVLYCTPTGVCRDHFEFQSIGHMGLTGVGKTGSGQSHCQPFILQLNYCLKQQILLLLRLHSIWSHFAPACHFVSLNCKRFLMFCSALIKTKCLLHKNEAVYEHVNV